MDERKYLIILKDEDKTTEISSYNIEESKVKIIFNDKSTVYTYGSKNVIIKKNSERINLINKDIYCEDMLMFDIIEMLDFEEKIKVIFNNKKSQVYNSKDVKIKETKKNTKSAKNILGYWRDISQYTKMNNESEAFLKREFDKLRSVSKMSVLNYYLHKEPLKEYSGVIDNIIFPFKINLSQKQALENVFKSNISIIQGPPGTGKTQTILNIIANLAIVQNKTVAVVSNNNSAVRNVQEKLSKHNYDFFLALLGKKVVRERFFENLPSQQVDCFNTGEDYNKLLEELKNLNDKINTLLELRNQKAKIQQRLSAYYTEKRHFESYYSEQNIEEIKKLPLYKKTPDRIISFLVDNYFLKQKSKLNFILHTIKIFLKYGFTDFKTLKENEIDIILNLQKEYYSLKIESLENKKTDINKKLDKNSFSELLEKHRKLSRTYFNNKIYEKYCDKKIINFNNEIYKKDFDKFIDRFPVILSTTHSLRNCIPENYLFDYLIIDESSQVDLLTGTLALSCCKNAIIVGDTKQLPQIVDKKIENKINTIDIEDTYNYFKHNILSSMLCLYKDTVPIVMLKEHYRCHPKIIEFCNQKYYSNELIPYTEENEDDIPLVLYRTPKGNHMRIVTKGGKRGRYNQRELDIIRKEVLINSKVYNENLSDIGFATPYRKQLEKANTNLFAKIECDTIHKYQGREKPIMIMSTVLDGTWRGKQGISFVDDPCIINVAVSRAIKQFVLVTDNKLFYKHSKEVSDLIKYMEYNSFDTEFVESEVVSVFDLLYKEYSEKLISFKSRLVRKSKYESENIMWTLLEDILSEDKYNTLDFVTQVYLKNLLKNTDKLNEKEEKLVRNNSSVDFLIYNKLDKRTVLIIEVDGFNFHENKPEQLQRDKIKNDILKKYNLPILRLATNGSGEREKILTKLDEEL